VTKIFYHKLTRYGINVEDDELINNWPEYVETEPPITQYELDEMAKLYRKQRDNELKRTDALMISDRTPDQDLIDYRQSLRDAPDHPDWPLSTPNIDFRGQVLHD